MFELNEGQKYIVNEAVNWYYNSYDQVFQYSGGPGTGKSVVLMEIIKRLGLDILTEVCPMSFIGSASLVMRMKGLFTARTIHSWLYQVKAVDALDENGNVIMDTLLNKPIKVPKFIPVDYLDPRIKLIVIDEGYTVPLSMRAQLEKFGLKILVCGDRYQLPPVGDQPAFLTSGNIYYLNEVMRQQGRDDIIYLTNRVRAGLPLLNGYYGNSLVINYNDLTDNMLLWADQVICCKNKTRDDLNYKMRGILGYNSNLPQYGEKVVCRKNNWLEGIPFDNGGELNLVNGLIGNVASNPDVSTFDGKLFSMDFVPSLVPNVTFNQTRCNYKYMMSDYQNRNAIKNNRYEVGNMFEYAYAITDHVAQGSQWHRVVYIEERMHPDIQTNLNVVGASRADQQLIYVKGF